jgi:hypothetical protein
MTQKAFTLKQLKQPGTQHVQPQQLSTFSLNDSQMQQIKQPIYLRKTL